MQLKLKSQQNIVIGLDIGFSSIKAVVIEHLKNEKKFLDCIVCRIDNSSISLDKKAYQDALLKSR